MAQRKAIVTGGCHGLGRALVISLIERGFVVTVLDCDKSELETLSDQFPANIVSHYIDLTSPAELEIVVDELIKTGPYDLVFLNAGISATGNFETISALAYEQLLLINTQSTLVLCAALAGNKAIRASGTIIFISSLSHVVGYPGAAVYAASKDAIAIYAKNIHKAYAKSNISVLTIFPGPIRTNHAQRHAPAGADPTKRMDPAILAVKIIEATDRNRKVLYPNLAAKLSHIAGRIAPRAITRLMHKIIYRNMIDTVYFEEPVVITNRADKQ